MGNFFPLFSNYTVHKVVFVISTLEKFIKKRGKSLIHYFYHTMVRSCRKWEWLGRQIHLKYVWGDFWNDHKGQAGCVTLGKSLNHSGLQSSLLKNRGVGFRNSQANSAPRAYESWHVRQRWALPLRSCDPGHLDDIMAELLFCY